MLRNCSLRAESADRSETSHGWVDPPIAHTLEDQVITLGIILLIIGFLAKIAILWSIGIVILVIGVILALLGMMGRAVGGRAHYY